MAERNVLRSTEPWRKQRLEDEAKEKELAEEGEDSMKNLEKSVLASRAEEGTVNGLSSHRVLLSVLSHTLARFFIMRAFCRMVVVPRQY